MDQDLVRRSDGSNAEGGTLIGKFTEPDAEADAVFQCKRGQGGDCAARYSYYNQCVALTPELDSQRWFDHKSLEVGNGCMPKKGAACVTSCTQRALSRTSKATIKNGDFELLGNWMTGLRGKGAYLGNA
jgi:hypothetical protein